MIQKNVSTERRILYYTKQANVITKQKQNDYEIETHLNANL